MEIEFLKKECQNFNLSELSRKIGYSRPTIKKFLNTVRSGLMNEGHHRPVHQLHYIDWALSAVAIHLRMFNKRVGQSQNQPETDTPPAS